MSEDLREDIRKLEAAVIKLAVQRRRVKTSNGLHSIWEEYEQVWRSWYLPAPTGEAFRYWRSSSLAFLAQHPLPESVRKQVNLMVRSAALGGSTNEQADKEEA